MSNIALKHYSAFHREILLEILNKKELKELDKKYNQAKLKRALRGLGSIKLANQLKELI